MLCKFSIHTFLYLYFDINTFHLINVPLNRYYKASSSPQAYCQLELTYVEHNLIFYLQETLLARPKVYTSLRQKQNTFAQTTVYCVMVHLKCTVRLFGMTINYLRWAWIFCSNSSICRLRLGWPFLVFLFNNWYVAIFFSLYFFRASSRWSLSFKNSYTDT